MRLDQAIALRYPHISRRQARQLLAEHRVLVNERPVSAASREVNASDRIAIVGSHPDLHIVRMTDAWVAIDKPTGLPVQPARDRTRRSVQELLGVQLKRSGQPHQVFVVHRIDTATSGVVLFARTRESAAHLSKLFASGEMRKTYIAKTEPPLDRTVVIDTPIDGKSALTEVEPGVGYLKVRIHTGRTHQIRRHLASIGHPVAGDRRYGSTVNAPRLMLHAWQLEHADIGLIEAPVPADFV